MIANEFANTKQYHVDMQYFYVATTEAQCLTIKNKVSAKYVDILQRIKSSLALYKPVKFVCLFLRVYYSGI